MKNKVDIEVFQTSGQWLEDWAKRLLSRVESVREEMEARWRYVRLGSWNKMGRQAFMMPSMFAGYLPIRYKCIEVWYSVDYDLNYPLHPRNWWVESSCFQPCLRRLQSYVKFNCF